MCAGTIFWGNVGRIVYAANIEDKENRDKIESENYMMLGIDFREVLASGGKDIVIDGPYTELEDELMQRFEWYTEKYGAL
jgi:tRNA(Arg) A34 adenosine deaminase TadA